MSVAARVAIRWYAGRIARGTALGIDKPSALTKATLLVR